MHHKKNHISDRKFRSMEQTGTDKNRQEQTETGTDRNRQEQTGVDRIVYLIEKNISQKRGSDSHFEMLSVSKS